jgi:hypothetical protein
MIERYKRKFREDKTELELLKAYLSKNKIQFKEIFKANEITLKGVFPKGDEFNFIFQLNGMLNLAQVRGAFGLDTINPIKGYKSVLKQIQAYL